jgi:hypothetical protein
MSAAPRRVRSDMVIRTPHVDYPHPARYLVIEFPRVASTWCGNRPPIWEWVQSRAVEVTP